MEITIYGSGCAKCVKLAANAQAAADKLGLDVTITKITDTAAIVDAGVLKTPALGINDDLKTMGRVASPEEVERVLAEAWGERRSSKNGERPVARSAGVSSGTKPRRRPASSRDVRGRPTASAYSRTLAWPDTVDRMDSLADPAGCDRAATVSGHCWTGLRMHMVQCDVGKPYTGRVRSRIQQLSEKLRL